MSNEYSNLADQFLELMAVGESGLASPNLNIDVGSASPLMVAEITRSIKEKRPDLLDGSCLSNVKYQSHSEADFALSGLIVREALKRNVPHGDLEVITQSIFQNSRLYRVDKWRTVVTQTIPNIIQRELERSRVQLTDIERINPSHSLDPKQFLEGLALSELHVKDMQDAKFIVDDMIVRGHVVAFVAPANSGKTALLVHFSAYISLAGYQLEYVNCDASPSDLKRHFEHAKKYKYRLIAPDAIPGKSPRDVLIEFRKYLESGSDLSNVVVVLDTLKKFVDVIEKRAAKELYTMLRGLTVRGCTVVLLGHTNKHLSKDNQTIYEGTADLRNDLDELIYLDVQKDETKSILTITTRPDKVRADIKPRSFHIHLPDRRVEELDYAVRILPRSEEEILDLATEGIYLGKTSQKDLVEFITQRVTSGAGDKKVKAMLATHAHSNNRIKVSRSGRAKDLLYSLTAQERVRKTVEEESTRNLPF